MSSLVVDILEGFLGDTRKHNDATGQIAFDCPACGEDKGLPNGDGKGNLEINYNKGVYKCWACYETNNMHGSIPKLIRRYGDTDLLKNFLLIKPQFNYEKDEDAEAGPVDLPEGFATLTPNNGGLWKYRDALSYLKFRGITEEMIVEHGIGWTTVGEYANRIIIPSYNAEGQVNYFVGRTFQKWAKPKYLNPDAEKQLIIFNEKLINWDSTIYLVEGTTDHVCIPNSIPLLGKYISDLLFWMLQTKANAKVVLVMDGDAWEDTKKLYRKLNTMNLYNRVRAVRLREDLDVSKINEKWDRKTLVSVLKKSGKIPESEL